MQLILILIFYRNVPNRKISNGSSGSQGRKCSTNYPKPKESVHSSSEPEVHSPLEITDTETSDVCQIVNINSVSKEKEVSTHRAFLIIIFPLGKRFFISYICIYLLLFNLKVLF